MDKGTPHYKLSIIKNLIVEGKVSSTRTALEGAAALNLDFDGILKIIKGLTSKDFYKSMTTHKDHKIWQDVYRPKTVVGDVYLKLTVIEHVLIVSFKEL